jgi:CRP/FNR family transcriptional regulator, anaerobic regulatory protein
MNKYESFIHQFHVKRFRKGEIVLVQGEVPPNAYILKKGIIKTYNLTSQGEEKPISFDVPGEVFPVAWTFNKVRYAQYYYEAFTDCEVYCVPKQEYNQFLLSHPETLHQVLSDFIDRYVNFQMRVNALEQSKAATKIINTIHFLCLHFGRDLKKDTVQIQLPLTQQDLANFMGLTRETTGIELKKLQRQGILSYRRQNYIVNTAKLDELLDEDYDQGRVLER